MVYTHIIMTSNLTGREKVVAALVAQGLTSVDIAKVLGISKRTVDKHRLSLNHKLGCRRDQLKEKLKEVNLGN